MKLPVCKVRVPGLPAEWHFACVLTWGFTLKVFRNVSEVVDHQPEWLWVWKQIPENACLGWLVIGNWKLFAIIANLPKRRNSVRYLYGAYVYWCVVSKEDWLLLVCEIFRDRRWFPTGPPTVNYLFAFSSCVGCCAIEEMEESTIRNRHLNNLQPQPNISP